MVSEVRKQIIPEIGLSADSTVSSLEYARMIQSAILCSRNGLYDLFKDVELIYEPKNILSGDFYFYQKRKGVIYLAVCDCTGHGISGALLSILAHNMLERSLRKFDHLPDMMKYLNKTIIDSFSQESDINDMGMDLVMLKLDENTLGLEVIGARRPLWIARDNELIELKTSRNSIGTNPEYVWEEQSFQLVSGDRLALFSDGLSDQFGENDKKYTKKRLVHSFLENSHLSQHEMITSLKNDLFTFQGNTIQTDDMLFLSFDV